MDYHNNSLIYSHFFDESSEFFKNYGVVIVPGGEIRGDVGGEVKGLISAPISLSFASQYTGTTAAASVADAGKDLILGKANVLVKGVIQTALDAGAYTMTTVANTIGAYSGSDKVRVGFEIIVMGEFSSMSYKQIIDRSLKMVEPKLVDEIAILTPFGYRNSYGTKSSINFGNTFTVVIGNQIMATLLIPKSFTYNYSAQLRDNGEPMYLKLNYEFETGRIMDANELSEWWIH